jgi:uncharacterized membrane protein YqjE
MTAPTRTPGQVLIAGVPWPVYKLSAVAAGLAVLLIVGVLTGTAGTAVVAGSAVSAVVWLAMGVRGPSNR